MRRRGRFSSGDAFALGLTVAVIVVVPIAVLGLIGSWAWSTAPDAPDPTPAPPAPPAIVVATTVSLATPTAAATLVVVTPPPTPTPVVIVVVQPGPTPLPTATAAPPAPAAAPPAPTAAPPTAPTRPPAPPDSRPAATALPRVGQTTASGGLALTVAAVARQTELAPSVPPRAGHLFLVVDLTLENERADLTVPYGPADFVVADATGAEHAALIPLGSGALATGQLRPGGRAAGRVAFEVPSTARGLLLTYHPAVEPPDFRPIRVRLGD